jgi:phosphoinositide-3-kinase regulatory subunit
MRKSSLFVVKGYYAMSIKCNNCINHCLIQQYSNDFGFANNRIFSSLDLVFDYQHREALNIHNDILNTFVLYIVNDLD